MNIAARSITRWLSAPLIVLILATSLTAAATGITPEHPAAADCRDGWREGQISSTPSTSAGLEFGLMWESETVWEFADPGGLEAVVRLNAGQIIPGDVVIEYLIRSCRPDGEVIGVVYGQASYAGSDSIGVSVSERYCAIPPVFEQQTSVRSDQIRWSNLREVLSTWRYVNEARHDFPIEHERMLFGPTGHLGFAIALRDIRDTGAIAIARVAAPDADVSEEPVADTETAGGEAPETESAQTGFGTPEGTAKFFLHAVMVDKDPVKAAEAWSPRVAASAIESVVANEIEFFSDRSSDLLLYVLSSLEYTTETTSDNDAIVYVVDGDEKAVVGRLVMHGDEWLIVALGYQLDADLNPSPEWRRVAGIE